MAKCKLCKVNIPNGTEYCKDCQDKEKSKVNESYLDSLLNSVKDSVPATESIYKKKTDSNENPYEQPASRKQQVSEDEDDSSYDIDLNDITDFDQFYGDDDLESTTISDSELFGENLSEIFNMEEKPEDITDAFNDSKDNIQDNDIQDDNFMGEEDSLPSKSQSDDITRDDISNSQEEENGLDPDINDLLNSLNLGDYDPDAKPTDIISTVTEEPLSTKKEESGAFDTDDFETVQAEEDDFLSLLNQVSLDDPVAEDVRAINDLLSGKPVANSKKADTPSDVGEVFSDALKVVSSLNDPNINEEELLAKIPDKKEKKKKKDKDKIFKEIEELEDIKKEDVKKGPKKSLFKRLFGNVPDENADKKQALTEESEAAKETSKKSKVKGKKGAGKDSEEEKAEPGKRKRPGADTEEDTGEAGKDKPKEKKAKKKKTKEVIQVIDEIEEDEGRINRLGASIVFVFFGLLVLLLIVGTNVVSYTLSIQHATNYFGQQKYNQAYNEVYGINIKDEDIVIYDKIMTVMFVNKQLNSYNNYYALGEYPKALDSLLKGLDRYDKYIELATMLGIKSDLDYVRSQILAELKNEFDLTESEAVKIVSTKDSKVYSSEVYEVVLGKTKN